MNNSHHLCPFVFHILSSIDGNVDLVYHATVWVFSNISGMVSFLPDGSIHSVNNNFSLHLFGYTQQQLEGQVNIISDMLHIYSNPI